MYYLKVRRPVPFMVSLVEAFCGDAHMSLEGDLSNLRWSGRRQVDPRIGVLLRRNTLWPKQDYVILPLEEDTLVEIKERVLPVVGLAKKVLHVQIEQHRESVFGAYDEFDDDCVWVASRVGPEFLDRLKQDGCLRSYEPAPDRGESGEERLVSLLTERDISLDEALQAFGADRHIVLQVLCTYLSSGDLVLKSGDEVLSGRSVRRLLAEPGRLESQGGLCLSPAPLEDKAQEKGQEDDPLEWMPIIASLWPSDGKDKKIGKGR
jgi:hypothetical protein